MREQLYALADELRAMANAGLRYANNPYDLHRYERLLRLSAGLLASLDEVGEEEVLAQYQDNLSHLSPLLGADAFVMREGKILLVQRRDNRLWAMPGGLAEVGETLAEAAVRELREETGLRGRAKRLLGLFDSRIWKSRTKAQLVHVVFGVEAEGEPEVSNETLDVGFFEPAALPPLHYGHADIVPYLLSRTDTLEAHADL